MFGLQIQPSEFTKLALILVLARYLSEPSRDLSHPKTLFVALGITAVPFALILDQPDLGTAVTLLPLVATMLYAAGVPFRYLLLLVGLGLLALVPGWFILDGYQRERLLVFF
ncbi:MAG: FtsW/RodA/SpoVE family cell cycle protein [Kiritimatiellae bacterium]|nr:FtsW/RodA/SpoVE family cell cycle protein [Kiritimatiellia bacterium]